MSKIIGLILSGGMGSRLGGVNKGLVEVEGVTLVQRVYDVLAPQVDEVYISANEDIDEYRLISNNVLQDDPRFYRNGPLAGIHALKNYVGSEDLIQVVTCDLPLLPSDLVSLHKDFLQQEQLDAVYPKDVERKHYTLLMLKGECLAVLEQLLLDKQLRVRDFLAKMNHQALLFEDASQFINGNDWQSMDEIVRILKERAC